MFVCVISDTATPEFYTDRHTLSLHDALPIWQGLPRSCSVAAAATLAAIMNSSISRWLSSRARLPMDSTAPSVDSRSEEHTSELQSLMRTSYAVFCLKKNTQNITHYHSLHTLTIKH